MKSIRRLYFYLVAFISIEVVLWGLVGLLRSIVDDTISGGADALAQALALILVGVPIFLIHWLWAQRVSVRDPEEKSATLRAVFLYAILLSTLIPVVQNLLAFINRSFIEIARVDTFRALVGGSQTLADNLIAIFMNGIVAAYFWNILRGEWAALTDRENFSEVRRLYRYIWMLYGLLMTVFGTQQILRYLFYIPSDVLGELGHEVIVNGMALIVVGIPIWVYSWRVIQDSLSDPAEMASTLRLGILYLLALGGVITVITTAWSIVNTLLLLLLGQDLTFGDVMQRIGGPLSIAVPLGAVWAYYGHWLNRHIEATGDTVRQAAMKRLYYYILSFIGLIVLFVGVALLIAFVIEAAISLGFSIGSSLAIPLSSILVGLPIWLTTWRPMQVEALSTGELGDHARRSLIRKSYSYLVLFVSVIGGMATAVGLVYILLRVVLTGDVDNNFAITLLNLVQLLFLFGVVMVYHLNVLRADGASTADSLAERQNEYSVLIVDSGDGFVESVKAALMKLGSNVQMTVTPPSESPQGNFNALVLNGSVATDAPDWVRSFNGSHIIVQNEAKNIVWADGAAQAAQSVQQLAEGQEIRIQKPARSAWMYVVYIFAALFALELLFFLFALGISSIAGF